MGCPGLVSVLGKSSLWLVNTYTPAYTGAASEMLQLQAAGREQEQDADTGQLSQTAGPDVDQEFDLLEGQG